MHLLAKYRMLVALPPHPSYAFMLRNRDNFTCRCKQVQGDALIIIYNNVD
jgi:hypothetical protein